MKALKTRIRNLWQEIHKEGRTSKRLDELVVLSSEYARYLEEYNRQVRSAVTVTSERFRLDKRSGWGSDGAIRPDLLH